MASLGAYWNRLYRPSLAKSATPDGRIFYWDNLKFLAITLVVVGHFTITVAKPNAAIRAITLFIYLFHMPLFAFVSGYFSKSFVRGTRFRYEKVLSYLLLYFLLKGAIFLEDRFVLGKDVTFRPFYEPGLPWYMLAMAAWLTAVYLLRDVRPRYVLSASLLGAVLAGYSANLDSTLAAVRIVAFAPFFLAGFYVGKEKVQQLLATRWLPAAGMLTLLGVYVLIADRIATLSVFQAFMSGLHSYARLGFPSTGGLIRVVVLCLSAMMIVAVMVATPRGVLFFTRLGQRTLQIYCLHRLVYPLFQHWRVAEYYRHAFPNRWPLLVVLTGVAVTFLCSMKVFEPPFRWVMSLPFGPKPPIAAASVVPVSVHEDSESPARSEAGEGLRK